MNGVSRRAAAGWLVGLAAVGCGGNPGLDSALHVYPVAGVLTHKGAPMAGAVVTYYPLAPKGKYDPAPSATAGADGRYVLTTYATGDGAPAGEYRVTVYWPGKRRGTPNEDGDLPPDQLKEAFAGKKTSPLRAVVGDKANAIDFRFPPPQPARGSP